MKSFSQRSFTAGEVAPTFYARSDMTKYQTGVKTARNLMVMRHGGLMNRPGTKFIAETKDSSKKTRFIPFMYRSDRMYLLEFGDLYVRFYKDGAPVYKDFRAVTSITKANPAVVGVDHVVPHNFVNGQEIKFEDVAGMTELNGNRYIVASVTTSGFSLKNLDDTNVNSTSFGTYTSGGNAYILNEVVTPYTQDELEDIYYSQYENSVTLAHPNHAPSELVWQGTESWVFQSITFGPSLTGPTGITGNMPGSVPGALSHDYAITTIAPFTLEESSPSYFSMTSADEIIKTRQLTLSWTAVSGASGYNVYRLDRGIFGFIGTTGTNSFSDIGVDPDISDTLAKDPGYFTSENPAVVSQFQQRRIFANLTSAHERLISSRIAVFKNFQKRDPVQDDDPIDFKIRGKQQQDIRHVVDLGKMIMMTSSGEWVADGDQSGAVTPTAINLKQHSYHGSSKILPVMMSGNMLYVQAGGSDILDFGYDFQIDGYRGNNLGIFSAHLFERNTVVDWTYQQSPHSIVWIARDDGALIGLTYLKEHEIAGWHRHDFDGLVEHVCCVPENGKDVVYLLIKRNVNGAVKRYVERMTDRTFTDVKDLILMDCAKTYDGRNTNVNLHMSLNSGAGWTTNDDLQLLTDSVTPYFVAGDVGKSFVLSIGDEEIRFVVSGYTSGNIVVGRANRDIPVSMRSVFTSDWARGFTVLTGLSHIEGKDVSIFADGLVVASPNNEGYDKITVTNGSVTLPRSYAYIHVGLPITADLETLNINIPQVEGIITKKINTSSVSVQLNETRGVWLGTKAPTDDGTTGLTELKPRTDEDYDEPNRLISDTVDQNIGASWQQKGRVFARQVDPLPVHYLSVSPTGYIPGGGN